MNYAEHYRRLIDRARGRALEGYCERHHVVPRCMGGSNEKANLVDLTAEEHYVAHQLLVKMHPRHGRLAHAAVLMAKRASGNKAYGWLRRRSGIESSKTQTGNTNWLGKKHTEQWKAERRAAMLGQKMPAAGVEKMAASKRGKALSKAHRLKISAGGRGVPRSAETRARMSAAKAAWKPSEAMRQAVSAADRGRVFSAEVRAKMSASRTGIKRGPMSEATRAKISAAHKARLVQLA